jgi:hypothetical protein
MIIYMSFLIPFDMDKVERANLRKILSQNKPKISNVNFDRANKKLEVYYTGGKDAEVLDVGMNMDDVNDIIEMLKTQGVSQEEIEKLRTSITENNTYMKETATILKQKEGLIKNNEDNIVANSTNIKKNAEEIGAAQEMANSQSDALQQQLNVINANLINQIQTLETQLKDIKPGMDETKFDIFQSEFDRLQQEITAIKKVPGFDASEISAKITSLENELKAIKDRPVVERIDIGTEAGVGGLPAGFSRQTKYLTQHGGTALDSLYRKWLAQ